MSDLVVNPEDRFSHNEAHIVNSKKVSNDKEPGAIRTKVLSSKPNWEISKTRAVRGSDYSPALGLSEQKDKLVIENWRD